MTDSPKLQQVIRKALSKRISTSTFVSLVKQLNSIEEVKIEQIKSILTAENDLDPLLPVYLLEVATHLHTDINFITLMNILKHLTAANQQLFLKNLNLIKFSNSTHSDLSYLNDNITLKLEITNYIKHLLKLNNSSLIELFSKSLVVFIVQFKLEFNNNSSQLGLVQSFIIKLNQVNVDASNKLNELLNLNLMKISTNSTTNSSFKKTNKLIKLIWLNYAIVNWCTTSPNFLKSFEKLIKINSNQNILNELISISFESISEILPSTTASTTSNNNGTTSNSETMFIKNWKLYFTKILPLLIKNLNLKNLQNILLNSINKLDPNLLKHVKDDTKATSSSNDDDEDMFDSFPSTNLDIRHEFLRNCIAIKILPKSSFFEILKNDSNIDNRPLIENDDPLDEHGNVLDINEMLHKTLIDINPEFVSLQDSGLLEFLNSFERFQVTKQIEFTKLANETIQEFIKKKNFSNLNRFLLALSLNQNILHLIIFYTSPKVFLKPILNLLDDWDGDDMKNINSQNNPNSSGIPNNNNQNDNNDDQQEELNLQENFKDFGTIFLIFLLIIKNFNISINDLILIKESKNSFIIKYLTNLGCIKQINPLENEKQTELFNGWSNALFDSTGIPDDLIKSSSVKDCIQIFPIIFKQMIIGCKQNNFDLETIRGGLEYFLQPFLLGTISSILLWSENYLWKNQDEFILINLIKTLLFPNELNDDSVYIHKLILLNFGKKFSVLLSKNSYLKNNLISPDNLNTLKRFNENNNFLNNAEDDNNSLNSQLIKTSPIQLLSNQLGLLINPNSSSSSNSNLNFSVLKRLLDLIEPDVLIEYLINELQNCRNSNIKSFEILVELSCFLIVVNYLNSSNSLRLKWLSSLKSLKVSDPSDLELKLSSGFSFLNCLITKRRNNSSDEILALFYNKILENVDNLSTLDL